MHARRSGHGTRRRPDLQGSARRSPSGRSVRSSTSRRRSSGTTRSREGTIHVDAVDKRGGSRARAQIVYKVAQDGDGGATAVELVQNVTLSGPLAQFGRTGVIEDINAQMTRQFAECLAGEARRSARPVRFRRRVSPPTASGSTMPMDRRRRSQVGLDRDTNRAAAGEDDVREIPEGASSSKVRRPM